MKEKLRIFLKQLFCRHDYNKELVTYIDCKRKLYRCTCKKCGKVKGKTEKY